MSLVRSLPREPTFPPDNNDILVRSRSVDHELHFRTRTTAMRMRRLKIAIPCGLALGLLGACQSSREVEQPLNARSLIMVHKAILWRDLESIKNASIAAPQ